MFAGFLPVSNNKSNERSYRNQLFLFVTSSILLVLAALMGCGDNQSNTSDRGNRSEETRAKPTTNLADRTSKNAGNPSQPETAVRSVPVELIESSWNELQSLIGQHKGKVIVLDIWSTSCEPCMTEFPSLVALQKKYPDDLVAISFDVDYPGIKNKPVTFYRERVLNFLGSQAENKILHRMCTTPADELFSEIKLDSIPAVYVYDRDNHLVKRFEGSSGGEEGVSYEKQVIPFVEGLLKI